MKKFFLLVIGLLLISVGYAGPPIPACYDDNTVLSVMDNPDLGLMVFEPQTDDVLLLAGGVLTDELKLVLSAVNNIDSYYLQPEQNKLLQSNYVIIDYCCISFIKDGLFRGTGAGGNPY